MAQGYKTLQEAATFLQMDADELKQLAQKKEIRSFQDRGSLRFRVQDVEELGRRRGTTSSEPEMLVPDAPSGAGKQGPKSGAKAGPKSPIPKSPAPAEPKSAATPRSPVKKPASAAGDIFGFSLDADDRVDIGKEILSDIPGGSKKSGAAGKAVHSSPHPKPGSDSDVKLVSARPKSNSDSDVHLLGQDSGAKSSESPSKTPRVARQSVLGVGSPIPKKSSSGVISPQPDSSPKKRPSGLAGAAKPADSGVRLVPMDSDSDVKIVGAGSEEISLGDSPPASSSDSDIRLEKYQQLADDSMEGEFSQTEEINLDEEIRKQEAALAEPQPKLKRKSKVHFPTNSPFELSGLDLDLPAPGGPKTPPVVKKDAKSAARPKAPADSDDIDLAPAAPMEESSEFELSLPGDPRANLDPDASDDFSVELPADDSALGGDSAKLTGPSSGISLNNPVDAGISLEEGNPAESDMDLDLSLEVDTPKPAAAPADSDSEFELSLDADDSGQTAGSAVDSEFELTLDDSGGLAPQEADEQSGDSLEKDIFETDFEVPALEEDSGSQVAALDTDLDSSDFDIALDDSAVEDESASQVVALDEEADAGATTRADEDDIQVDDGEDFGDLESSAGAEEGVADVEEEDVDDAKVTAKGTLVEPASWGALPVVFMLPCVIVMLLVGLLGFELVQSGGGYKSPGFLTKAISELIGKPIK